MFAVLAAAALLASTAGAGVLPSISAPLLVSVGKTLELGAHGFAPDADLRVTVDLAQPSAGAHPCCGFAVGGAHRTDSLGEAVIRFRWPRYYTQEPGGVRFKWQPGALAVIWVTPASDYARTARTVVVIGR